MRKPNYCKGIVIVHGKSELLFVEHIRSNLHLPIGIFSMQNGKTSIQIDGLMSVLYNNTFKNKRALTNTYVIEEENGEFKNFFVMPIMDLDDTTKERAEKYKSCEMFNGHWLRKYMLPIWNDKNMDQVLFELGLINKLPNSKEKGRVYEEIFPTNRGESDLEQVRKLLKYFENSKKTNMDVFIEKCLESL